MSKLAQLCDDMNNYINTQGQLPSSTSKRGFLNAWHNLSNEDWISVFNDAAKIHKSPDISVRMPQSILSDITDLLVHIDRYRCDHANILNPTIADERALDTCHKEIEGVRVKKILWRTMMNVRERVYNPAMGIDLPNANSSIGKLNTNQFAVLFEDNHTCQ